MTQNQRDYQRITRLVTEPLAAVYGKPYDPVNTAALVSDLARFPDQVLADAVAKVRQEQEFLPKIATLVAACKACWAQGDNSQAQDFYAGLQARGHRARERAAEYLDRFAGSPLARQARAEGWEARLIEYAQAAASFQAQLIERVPNPGYPAAVYRWVPEPEPGSDQPHPRDAVIGRFLAEGREAAGQGDIRVNFPTKAVERWRTRVPA